MMGRALQLRPFYETFLFEARVYFDTQFQTQAGKLKKGVREPNFLQKDNKLEESDWEAIQALHEILFDFELVVKSLQGDSQGREKRRSSDSEIIDLIQGASWEILDAYEFLLGSLENAKIRVRDLADGEHLVINVNNAWKKLDHYYTKISESPLTYAAAALNPKKKWDSFEIWRDDHPEWIDAAKQQVRDLWRTQYKDLSIDTDNRPEPPKKAPRLSSNKFTNFKNQKRAFGVSTPSSPLTALAEVDEFEQWQQDQDDGEEEEDPRAYWHKRRQKYPCLSRMALDLHTVLPMSAEVERLFSVTGRMVVPLRNRLQANTLSLCQTLRSWYDDGVVRDLDPILKWSKDAVTGTEEPDD